VRGLAELSAFAWMGEVDLYFAGRGHLDLGLPANTSRPSALAHRASEAVRQWLKQLADDRSAVVTVRISTRDRENPMTFKVGDGLEAGLCGR
jgi:hypothetical protein